MEKPNAWLFAILTITIISAVIFGANTTSDSVGQAAGKPVQTVNANQCTADNICEINTAVINGLSSGNGRYAYACVDSIGTLIRSNTPCDQLNWNAIATVVFDDGTKLNLEKNMGVPSNKYVLVRDGIEHQISLIAVNVQINSESTATVAIDGEYANMVEGQTKTINGLVVTLEMLAISNI